MDEQKAAGPAPVALVELSEPVRKWLNGLDEEDIQRFRRWNHLIWWAESSGRYGWAVLKLTAALLGIWVVFGQVIDRWWKGS